MVWILSGAYLLIGATVAAGNSEEIADLPFWWQRALFGLFLVWAWPAVLLVGNGD